MQGADGFIGHMVFWQQVLPKRPTDIAQERPSSTELRPHTSELVQPPFVA
ncbi:MAG TPA: hypothetical protein VE325_02805 [Burkholderiales bacterium]|nr:hypothetical protein [Burkholderiales bacterium]